MNQRNTIQRSLILDAVRHLPHPTADEVHSHITGRYPSISRGTVYRNLHVLAAQGRLIRVAVPDAADHFDHTLTEHYHIHCRLCGRVVDAGLPYQHSLLESIVENHGYLIEAHDIVLTGVCPACQTANITVPTVKN